MNHSELRQDKHQTHLRTPPSWVWDVTCNSSRLWLQQQLIMLPPMLLCLIPLPKVTATADKKTIEGASSPLFKTGRGPTHQHQLRSMPVWGGMLGSNLCSWELRFKFFCCSSTSCSLPGPGKLGRSFQSIGIANSFWSYLVHLASFVLREVK